MLFEGISIATQSLLARYSSDNSIENNRLRSFIRKQSFLAGAIVSGSFSLLFYLFRKRILSVFAKSSEIHSAAMEAVPVFILAQRKSSFTTDGIFTAPASWYHDFVVAKGISFPMNGIVLGRKEWGLSFCTMWVANFCCLGCVRILRANSPRGIWYAWTAYYLGQGLAAFAWYQFRHKLKRS